MITCNELDIDLNEFLVNNEKIDESKAMKEELEKMLTESEDVNISNPYEKEEDESLPHLGDKRKKVLTLKDLNRLKRIRNKKREEMAQDSVFVPVLYGPDMSNPEGGDMMGGLGM